MSRRSPSSAELSVRVGWCAPVGRAVWLVENVLFVQ